MSGRIRAAERFAFIPLLTGHHKSPILVHKRWRSERTGEKETEREGVARQERNCGIIQRGRGQRGASNAPDLISAFFIFDVTRPEFKWTRYNAVMRSATRAQPSCCFIFRREYSRDSSAFDCRSYSTTAAPFLALVYGILLPFGFLNA